jgi:sugar phosphate permease
MMRPRMQSQNEEAISAPIASKRRTSTSSTTNKNERYWQYRIATVLFLTMMASYCCIFTVGMTSPFIMKDLSLDESQFAYILTFARSVRILPKLLSGIAVDAIGGVPMFVFGNLLTSVFTLLFAYGSSANFLAIMWSGNNMSTTVVWPALVKISSRWFSYKTLGKVMGILSLSYLFGDGIAKLYLSTFIYLGVTWRVLFHISCFTLLVFVVLSYWGLRSSPTDVGLTEPEADPSNIFGSAGNSDEFTGIMDSLAPLIFSPPFWLLVFQSGGLNMLIYVCNDWISLYLTQQCNASESTASFCTILFPVAGGFSALILGELFDKFSALYRNVLMIVFHFLTILTVIGIYIINASYESGKVSTILVALSFGFLGFTVTGPYTLPSGVLSIKYGGKKVAATMVGIIDTIGTVASLFSALLGSAFLNRKELSLQERWSSVFLVMIIDGVFIMTLAIIYAIVDQKSTTTSVKKKPIPE